MTAIRVKFGNAAVIITAVYLKISFRNDTWSYIIKSCYVCDSEASVFVYLEQCTIIRQTCKMQITTIVRIRFQRSAEYSQFACLDFKQRIIRSSCFS